RIRDTAHFDLPGAFGGGLAIRALPRMQLSVDVIRRFWSQSDFSTATGDGNGSFTHLNDTTRFGIGITRLGDPEETVRDALGRRARWRAGFTYGTLPVSGNGETVSEWALTGGVGLPIQFDRGFIDGLIEFGKRGDAATTGLSESYLRIGFGATFQTLRSAF
ncbi:MAG: hypothetical protein KC729_17660, partial [Candidatus Eisenbacteria bacterium]|nr:hypothetical protein [Candidatus Eisenbacteria bacterium]